MLLEVWVIFVLVWCSVLSVVFNSLDWVFCRSILLFVMVMVMV